MQFSHVCLLASSASSLHSSLSILPFFSTLSSRSIVEYHRCNITWKPATHHLLKSHRRTVGNLAMTPGSNLPSIQQGEIGRRSGGDNVLEREGYAGFSLGLVAFGRGLDAIGFMDTLLERLFQYAGGKEIHNLTAV
ncbi:uncharacterized protein LOC112528125 [Cynara cardunculus var. scolymus]|uniref:Anaphase-promoting complex subunit 1 n=1 Tax=Cynara cardunculus var. scolymus TaxID=59895 RepID=A0A103XR51_CYNCS|nr:uncharacterized protein LOC112528125 [Cynara cardunculus var. scolymus]KVH95330.1 Anaphase-promoting complex subunit 1 [Cynara cardunculus var. scolymus]